MISGAKLVNIKKCAKNNRQTNEKYRLKDTILDISSIIMTPKLLNGLNQSNRLVLKIRN